MTQVQTKIAIVAAPYYDCVQEMIGIVEEGLNKNIANLETVTFCTSGAFELPLIVAKVLQGDFDAVVTLGAVEKGETGHGEAITNAVIPELSRLSVQYEKPVVLGIIGPRATLVQIDARAQSVASEAVTAVVTQLNILRSL
ncbi:MAG: 6,7-dimethyl-8-ribityllumazine synthase [Alteromonadaceae bacterium]|nr:MAG: 6,7-dimethyl-8-ribityllumazine synthase [Alteromonadaceae bacterium]